MPANVKLTPYQRSLLQAALECDGVTSRRLRLQDLNKLAARGLLEPVESELALYGKNWNREIVTFIITALGRAALAPEPEPNDARTRSTILERVHEHGGAWNPGYASPEFEAEVGDLVRKGLVHLEQRPSKWAGMRDDTYIVENPPAPEPGAPLHDVTLLTDDKGVVGVIDADAPQDGAIELPHTSVTPTEPVTRPIPLCEICHKHPIAFVVNSRNGAYSIGVCSAECMASEPKIDFDDYAPDAEPGGGGGPEGVTVEVIKPDWIEVTAQTENEPLVVTVRKHLFELADGHYVNVMVPGNYYLLSEARQLLVALQRAIVEAERLEGDAP